jgi:hypothetical protein
MSSLPDNNPVNKMENLHLFDNRLGYRYGQFLWYAFWFPSLVVMLCDDTVGHNRDFLCQSSLISSLTFLYYAFHQNNGSPASTPATQGLYCELLARWMLAAYHGMNNITTGGNPIAIMNCIQLITMGLFTVFKFPTAIYTTCKFKTYKKMEKRLTDNNEIY